MVGVLEDHFLIDLLNCFSKLIVTIDVMGIAIMYSVRL